MLTTMTLFFNPFTSSKVIKPLIRKGLLRMKETEETEETLLKRNENKRPGLKIKKRYDNDWRWIYIFENRSLQEIKKPDESFTVEKFGRWNPYGYMEQFKQVSETYLTI